MAYFAVSSHKTAVKVQKGSNAAGKHVTVPAVVVSRRGRFTVVSRRAEAENICGAGAWCCSASNLVKDGISLTKYLFMIVDRA